jgi:hypothetical protein
VVFVVFQAIDSDHFTLLMVTISASVWHNSACHAFHLRFLLGYVMSRDDSGSGRVRVYL